MKSIFKSKTVWVALLWAALTAFSPLVQAYASKYPTLLGCFISFVFIFLRIITKEGIMLKLNNKGHGYYLGWGFVLVVGIAVLSVISFIISIPLVFMYSKYWLFGLLPAIIYMGYLFYYEKYK